MNIKAVSQPLAVARDATSRKQRYFKPQLYSVGFREIAPWSSSLDRTQPRLGIASKKSLMSFTVDVDHADLLPRSDMLRTLDVDQGSAEPALPP